MPSTPEVEPETGALTSRTTLPAFVVHSTDDDGLRSMSVTIDLASLGGDEWEYDSVIGCGDGEVTILFLDQQEA